MEREHRDLAAARSLSQFFGALVVPGLFAFLGALAAAIRTADARMQNLTLTPLDDAGRRTRVVLGTVAGASVGIVLANTDALADSSGLTLIGLSFVVGYAVDVFFNLIDGVKLSLGGAEKQ